MWVPAGDFDRTCRCGQRRRTDAGLIGTLSALGRVSAGLTASVMTDWASALSASNGAGAFSITGIAVVMGSASPGPSAGTGLAEESGGKKLCLFRHALLPRRDFVALKR